MNDNRMNKPNKKTIEYYDWESVVEYLGWNENKLSKIWDYIIDMKGDYINGIPFTERTEESRLIFSQSVVHHHRLGT